MLYWIPKSSQAELRLAVPPNTAKQELMVVLLRHVVNTGEDGDYIALRVRREEVFSCAQGSLAPSDVQCSPNMHSAEGD